MSFRNNLPLFDAPSLSDIYMSDDDDDLSHGSSSAGSSAFPIYSATQPQNDTFLADMPEQSVSKIQTTQSPRISNTQSSSKSPRRTRMPSHSYRMKKNQPNPGNDPPGFDRTHSLDMTRFIYTSPYLVEIEESPSNAPTIPTTPTKKEPRSPKTDQYLQQRRMHLCVIFLTCMFLLLGVSVAVVGHKMFEGDEPTTSTSLEKEGSMAAVPIDLPDNIFRSPTLSPTGIEDEPTIRPTTTAPSILLNTMSPTVDLEELAPTMKPIAPPTRRPTFLPTQNTAPAPTSQPIPPPTRAPRTSRPTRAPVRSPARPDPTRAPIFSTVEPTIVPDKKAKEQKRQ